MHFQKRGNLFWNFKLKNTFKIHVYTLQNKFYYKECREFQVLIVVKYKVNGVSSYLVFMDRGKGRREGKL